MSTNARRSVRNLSCSTRGSGKETRPTFGMKTGSLRLATRSRLSSCGSMSPVAMLEMTLP